MDTVTVVLFAVALLEVTGMVMACQCNHRHPQQHFCRAGFVIRAEILSKLHEPILSSHTSQSTPQSVTTAKPEWQFPAFSNLRMAKPPPKKLRLLPHIQTDSWNSWSQRLRYTVHVQKVYKGERKIQTRHTIDIVSPADSGMCGLTKLDEGKTYLITGNFDDTEKTIHLCDWVSEWQQVTKSQRQGLKHIYKKYCDECIIKPDMIYWPPEEKEKNVCAYNPFLFHEDDCAAKYSACIRQPSGICDWLVTNQLKRCQNGQRIKTKYRQQIGKKRRVIRSA